MTRLEGATVVEKKRRRNSLNGNPRWSVVLDLHNGHLVTVRTRTDSSWGLEVSNIRDGDAVDVVVGPGNWVDGIWKVET